MVDNNHVFSLFTYNPMDFHYTVTDHDAKSKFDRILEEKWNEAEARGVFRYKLTIKEWRILEGPYKFLAQLNLDRANNRRAPEDITSMSQPFDAERFNFTKIPAKEILLDVGDGSGNNVIAANVSPIEWGHCLFLPERLKCLPQKMTEFSLVKALELLLLSSLPYLRLIFNSLCAHASVNHLHWHLYYLKHKMLLEDIELEELAAPVFVLKDYPAKGFCLRLSSCANDLRKLASNVYALIRYLQDNEIAHNVYVTRAKRNSRGRAYDDIRVYVWARKPSHGVKDTRAFVPAVCELFGHLSVRSLSTLYSRTSNNSVPMKIVQSSQNEYGEDTEMLPVIQDLQEWVKTPWELSKEN